ncbi:MAG TPA: hypothetical protein VJ984_09050 [Xanthomonadales bacterium]|nr:hypothetical protein [Xanthomonadales bacterium]
MKLSGMIALMMAMLLLVNVSLAQDAEESPGAADTRGCIPASELEQSSEGESGPDDEGSSENPANLPVCDENQVDEAGAEEPADVPESATDDESIEDIDDEEFGREFEPTDEISEDYPVPLPSDI